MYIKDSDYFKVIQYLYDRHSDGKYHDISNVLSTADDTDTSERYRHIVTQLYKDKLIKLTQSGASLYKVVLIYDKELDKHIQGPPIRSLPAKLTFKGVEWYNEVMKEEWKEAGPTKHLQIVTILVTIIIALIGYILKLLGFF